MRREKTKHKGVYRVGNEYYVSFYDGTVRMSKNGVPYLRKVEKRVGKGKLLADALDFKRDMEKKVKQNVYGTTEKQEKMTFNELVSLYEQEGEKKEYIVKVKKTYLDYFGGWKLSRIRESTNDLYLFRDKVKKEPKQRGKKEVTNAHVNRVLAGLRRLFNFAVNRRLMTDSPFPKSPKSGLFYPEKKGLRNFFTEDEMVRIIDAAQDWMKSLIITAFYTGMRMGEMLKLRWEHVNMDTGIIHLPESKTLKDPSGAGQRIVMQKELIALFKTFRQSGDWVFAKANGLPYQHWDIHKPFKALLKSLNIDTAKFSWKEIRHTTGTLLHLKGADPLAIKDQLRHTTFKTTESFYIGSDVEYQRQQNEKLVLPQAEA